MEKLTLLSSEEFLTKLASAAPVPGGGGAAALAGALAAALSSMVANLTIGKEKFAAQEQEVKKLLGEAEAVRSELLALVAQDAAVFGSFMDCYKLPKGTAEEKAARSAAICAAAKGAANVPLNIGRACLKVLALADRLVVIGNPGVVTDGAVSALLARAALRSAIYNVQINLPLTKDEEYAAATKAEMAAMEAKALTLENSALVTTNMLMGL